MPRGDLSLFDDPRLIPTLGVLSSGLGLLSGQGAGGGINTIIDSILQQRYMDAMREKQTVDDAEALRQRQMMSRAASEHERLDGLPVGFLLQSGVDPLVKLGLRMSEMEAKAARPGPQARLAAAIRSTDPVESATALAAANLVPGPGGEYISEAMARMQQSRELSEARRAAQESQFKRAQAAIESRFQRTPPSGMQISYDEQGRPIVSAGAAIGRPPAGFRWAPSGDLEAIPGGPGVDVNRAAAIASAATALRELGEVEGDLFAEGTGEFRKEVAAAAWARVPGTKGRGVAQKMRRAIEVILRARTGKAAPASEVSNYLSLYMPSALDSTAEARAKMNAAREFFPTQLQSAPTADPTADPAGLLPPGVTVEWLD